MRGHATLEKVIEMVNEISAEHHDQSVPVSDIRFESLEKAHIAGKEVEILPSAQHLFAFRLRVPHAYLIRCPEDLQQANLNFWLQEEQKARDTLMCRFDGQKLRAVFTERYAAFDNKEVLALMVEHGFSLDTEVHYILDGSLMSLKIPENDRAFTLMGNDRMLSGTSISNSEVGVLSFSIQAYIHRLVCSNGLISSTSVAKRFKHISTKAVTEFKEALDQIASESRHIQSQLRLSTKSQVQDPEETFNSFNRRFLISKKEAEAVQAAWEIESGKTMFAIINAYTRSAQDPGLTAEESYRLERVGGQILALVK